MHHQFALTRPSAPPSSAGGRSTRMDDAPCLHAASLVRQACHPLGPASFPTDRFAQVRPPPPPPQRRLIPHGRLPACRGRDLHPKGVVSRATATRGGGRSRPMLSCRPLAHVAMSRIEPRRANRLVCLACRPTRCALSQRAPRNRMDGCTGGPVVGKHGPPSLPPPPWAG